MRSHRFVSWWWRMQMFSCFRISWNTSSEIWVCLSEYSCPSESCSVITCVCLTSSSAALTFSSWLQATHTSVAYRLGKANTKDIANKDAIACVRRKFTLYTFKKMLWSLKQEKLFLIYKLSPPINKYILNGKTRYN
jgi:hypothetical protein